MVVLVKIINVYDKNSNILCYGKNVFDTARRYLYKFPKEYSEWKNNYHSDGKILEMLIKFLNQYYSSIGFTESSRDEHNIFSSKYVMDGPDDYLPYGKQFKVEFRTNEEKEKFQKLFSLINSKTK